MLRQSLWERTFDLIRDADLLKFFQEEINVLVCFYDLHESDIDLIRHSGYLYCKMSFDHLSKPLNVIRQFSPIRQPRVIGNKASVLHILAG